MRFGLSDPRAGVPRYIYTQRPGRCRWPRCMGGGEDRPGDGRARPGRRCRTRRSPRFRASSPTRRLPRNRWRSRSTARRRYRLRRPSRRRPSRSNRPGAPGRQGSRRYRGHHGGDGDRRLRPAPAAGRRRPDEAHRYHTADEARPQDARRRWPRLSWPRSAGSGAPRRKAGRRGVTSSSARSTGHGQPERRRPPPSARTPARSPSPGWPCRPPTPAACSCSSGHSTTTTRQRVRGSSLAATSRTARQPLSRRVREWAEETGSIPPPGVPRGVGAHCQRHLPGLRVDGRCRGVRAGPLATRRSRTLTTRTATRWKRSPGGTRPSLPGNPAVRPELLASIDLVMQALGMAGGAVPSQDDELDLSVRYPVVYYESNGWQHGDGSISHDDGESVSATRWRPWPSKEEGEPCVCCSARGEHPPDMSATAATRGGGCRWPGVGSPLCAEVFRYRALHSQGCPSCGQPPFLGSGDVAKAGGADPKVGEWPGWALSDQAIDWWAPRVSAAVTAAVPSSRRQAAGRRLHGGLPASGQHPGAEA